MKLKTIYLVLCVLGLALPYWQFVPWVWANGLNIRLFFRQLFANRIGGFFCMDVLVSAVALLVFTRREGARLPSKNESSPPPWLRTSPAMPAGVTDRLWSVEGLVAIWEAFEQRTAERAA